MHFHIIAISMQLHLQNNQLALKYILLEHIIYYYYFLKTNLKYTVLLFHKVQSNRMIQMTQYCFTIATEWKEDKNTGQTQLIMINNCWFFPKLLLITMESMTFSAAENTVIICHNVT